MLEAATDHFSNSCNPQEWFVAPEFHKKMSYAITRSISLLETSFSFPKESLKGLQRHENRQVRSERRHILVRLLQVMLYYSDHETFRVGRRLPSGAWQDYSLKELAEKLGEKVQRVKRAFFDLVHRSYVFVERLPLCPKNFYTPSIKRISARLFMDLGVTEAIDRMKSYRLDKRLSKQKKSQEKQMRVLGEMIQTRLNKPIPKKSCDRPSATTPCEQSMDWASRLAKIQELQRQKINA